MTETTAVRPTTCTAVLRPRHEDGCIEQWVGFRQLVSLAGEAVLGWFRAVGFGPATLYRDYGVRLTVIDSSVLMTGTLGVDEEVTARLSRVGGRYYDLRLSVPRGDRRVDVMRARLTLGLLRQREGGTALPGDLAGLTLDELAGLGTAVASHDPKYEEKALARAAAEGGPEGFRRSIRVPYSACHCAGRMHYTGYVHAFDTLVDEFLTGKGLCVSRLLAERGWMPAYSRARIRLLGEVSVDETMHMVYSVAQVVRNSLIDGRIDAHVRRGDRFVPVATAIVLHGYAHAEGPEAGKFVQLDQETIAALAGR